MPADSLAICRSLLTDKEICAIMEAAYLAFQNDQFEAERIRAFGGYSYAHRLEDREARGLPQRWYTS